MSLLDCPHVYLAGPMTGEPNFGYDHFEAVEEALVGAGYFVRSPHRNFDGDQTREYSDYIRAGLETLMTCDELCLIPGWENSRGVCNYELPVAIGIGMRIWEYEIGDDLEFSEDIVHYVYDESAESDSTETTATEAQEASQALEWASGGFVTKDSGARAEYSTGSRRDTTAGKGRFDLIPLSGISRLAGLMERGAAKYGDNNWKLGQPISRLRDSMLRHAFQAADGANDEDHLAAVAFNAFALIDHQERIASGELPAELDDTFKPRS